MSGKLDSKVAIVTGAAGGIGSAIVRRFLADGANVLATGQESDALSALHDGARSSGRLSLLAAELTDQNATKALISSAIDRFGKLDILVNNAGIGAAKSAVETTDDDWDRYLNVNLRPVFRIARDAIAHLEQTKGCILNIASVFGMVGFRGSAPYSASKAGVIGLTRQLAADCGPLGVRVNAVSPGVIETPMTQARLAEKGWHFRATVGTTPLGRPGRPDEIAAVTAFLCSEDASYITGEVIAVDGGWSSTRYFADRE